jgi:hypothetical protein
MIRYRDWSERGSIWRCLREKMVFMNSTYSGATGCTLLPLLYRGTREGNVQHVLSL